jgi:hypothetical protein
VEDLLVDLVCKGWAILDEVSAGDLGVVLAGRNARNGRASRRGGLGGVQALILAPAASSRTFTFFTSSSWKSTGGAFCLPAMIDDGFVALRRCGALGRRFACDINVTDVPTEMSTTFCALPSPLAAFSYFQGVYMTIVKVRN